jgi:photosystem II stability/assembly factor-like uncharacterized protein
MRGAVLTSVDGGLSWTRSSLPAVTAPLGEVACVGVRCVATSPANAVSAGGSTIVSVNTGTTWHDHSPSAVVTAISAISCTTKQRCAAIESTQYGPVLAASSDLGRAWTTTPLTEMPWTLTCSSRECLALSSPGGAGWQIVPDTLFTLPAGATHWRAVSDARFDAVSDLNCDGLSCVAYSAHYGSSGARPVLLTSDDGGGTWTRRQAPLGTSLDAATCPTTTACIAIGSPPSSAADAGNSLESNDVFATSNDGRSWSLIADTPAAMNANAPQNVQTSEITCSSASTCLAFTGSGVARTTDGGRSWADIYAAYYPVESYVLSCSTSTACLISGSIGGSNVKTSRNDGDSWATYAMPVGIDDLSASCTPSGGCLAAGLRSKTRAPVLIAGSLG